MNNNLVPWTLKPFYVGSSTNGATGDRSYTAGFLGLTDSASVTVIRTLAVSSILSLTQSKYWVETANNVITFTQAIRWDKQRPLTANNTLHFTDDVQAVGGQALVGEIYEGIADGVALKGAPLYMQASGHLTTANATDVTKASVAGVACEAGGGVTSGAVQYKTIGSITQDDWSDITGTTLLTPGSIYFLANTAGKLVTTAPSADGDFVVKVGRALTTKTLDIQLGEGVGL